MMKKLKFLLIALMMVPAVSTFAQADDVVITADNCRAHVAQHGVPDADPVIAFQGGSLEAQVIAFCQSLAYRGECDGVGLGQKLNALADRDQNGTINRTELEAYFAAAPRSESTGCVRQAGIPNLPAAGTDSRGITNGVLLGLLAAVLIVAGACTTPRQSR